MKRRKVKNISSKLAGNMAICAKSAAKQPIVLLAPLHFCIKELRYHGALITAVDDNLYAVFGF